MTVAALDTGAYTDHRSLAAGIKRQSTARQICELLRERMITLDLPPGMHLSRADLAVSYGVSQTPVRDALQMLEAEGLVVVFPQSRTEVTRIDIAQARETQFLRISLELEVVRALSCVAGLPAIAAAERIVGLQETALTIDNDMERFSTLDRQFHRMLFEAAGVADLWLLVQSRSGHIDRLRKLNLMDPGKAGTILSAHKLIIDRMKALDGLGAEDALRHHLSGTLSMVEDIKAAHPHYF